MSMFEIRVRCSLCAAVMMYCTHLCDVIDKSQLQLINEISI
uniref:Uncharacterized protein n=1 Tax=Ascaris lumbricoides TaxID=6252 RepID=A0A0M3I8E1_ASCLU